MFHAPPPGRSSAFSKKLMLFVMGAALVSGTANATTLLPRLGGQAVYDADLDLLWLANANLADSNTFGVSGIGAQNPGTMDWTTANTWIAAMNAGNYLGFNNWRLPTTTNTGCSDQSFNGVPGQGGGFNCTGSEMGHLFYTELGGTAGSPLLGSQGPFTNIQPLYWSGTPNTGGLVWDFLFDNPSNHSQAGSQDLDGHTRLESAWAVRTGDVAAVPEPASLLLCGVGALRLALSRRSRRRR